MNKSKIIAIIPARGGSKRLPKKNILPFAGKPLISYTIKAALDSGIFSKVVVSTDCLDIKKVSQNEGAYVPRLRSQELATDEADSYELIREALNWPEFSSENFTHFMLLQPTSPLRTAGDIVNSWNTLRKKEAEVVISVCKSSHPPYFINSLDKDKNMEHFLPKIIDSEKKEYYCLNGAIFLSSVKSFLESGSFYGGKTYAFEMKRNHSIDIDTKEDFDFAELVFKNLL